MRLQTIRPTLVATRAKYEPGAMSGRLTSQQVSSADAAALGVALGRDGVRAAGVIWLVVNAVNVLQAAGFATRPFAPWVNPALGVVISALAVPATWALIKLIHVRAGPLFVAGPLVFDLFVAFHVLVTYVFQIEWRDPVVPQIQAPYLTLFFGSILLMGLPTFRLDRRRWLVTVGTTVLLLAAMVYAMAMGVG
jgi:hypothetical protein